MNADKRIRKVFSGGNTTKGFYSFFDYIIRPDANRVFILKGGPGVGKSNFMKRVGKDLLDKGFVIEDHYCSSSNNSLDGLVIPKLKVVLLDGTPPHLYDPKYPGAIDEIINFGDYWDYKSIEAEKEKIVKVDREVKSCFSRAYRYLSGIEPILEDLTAIYWESINRNEFYKVQDNLVNMVFRASIHKNKIAYERHLFGSAITPRGIVDYLETTVGNMKEVYYIKGNWGTGWSELLREIGKKAIRLGMDIELYHTPFKPELVQDVIIPDLDLALTNNNKFLNQAKEIIDLDLLIDKNIIEKYHDQIDFNKKIYHQLLTEAINSIKQAKINHDRLEDFYIPNMDFDGINKKRREVVKRILEYED